MGLGIVLICRYECWYGRTPENVLSGLLDPLFEILESECWGTFRQAVGFGGLDYVETTTLSAVRAVPAGSRPHARTRDTPKTTTPLTGWVGFPQVTLSLRERVTGTIRETRKGLLWRKYLVYQRFMHISL